MAPNVIPGIKMHMQDTFMGGGPAVPVRFMYNDSYKALTSAVLDARRTGSTWTNVKVEVDEIDRHELYLLGEGEKKVEVEPVTRKHA